MKRILFLLTAILLTFPTHSQTKIGIAGLSHSHVLGLLRNMDRDDIEVVGIVEADNALAKRYTERFKLDPKLFYPSLDEMIDKAKPEGVVTFTSIYQHLEVVEACAPKGVHVMVEKPLAVSVAHAKKMIQLSEKHGTLLITNYETTWYPSHYKSLEMIENGDLGTLRKIIVYDGHTGPKEIRVNEEFLDWLTDPELNGGGAVIDFGCYGANLITWILQGQKPESVYAELKTYKPETYPEVDDDATIILSYPEMEGVIHASWNWPFNRKDMHIYGNTGYVFADNANTIRYRLEKKAAEKQLTIPAQEAPYLDPYTYFADAIQEKFQLQAYDLSAPELNLTVVEILEAAKLSHDTGKRVFLKH